MYVFYEGIASIHLKPVESFKNIYFRIAGLGLISLVCRYSYSTLSIFLLDSTFVFHQNLPQICVVFPQVQLKIMQSKSAIFLKYPFSPSLGSCNTDIKGKINSVSQWLNLIILFFLPTSLSVCIYGYSSKIFYKFSTFFFISEVESWIEEKRFLLTIFKCFAQSEGKFQENCSFLSRISKNKSRLGTEQKRHKKTNMNNHNHFLHFHQHFSIFNIFRNRLVMCSLRTASGATAWLLIYLKSVITRLFVNMLILIINYFIFTPISRYESNIILA